MLVILPTADDIRENIVSGSRI